MVPLSVVSKIAREWTQTSQSISNNTSPEKKITAGEFVTHQAKYLAGVQKPDTTTNGEEFLRQTSSRSQFYKSFFFRIHVSLRYTVSLLPLLLENMNFGQNFSTGVDTEAKVIHKIPFQ